MAFPQSIFMNDTALLIDARNVLYRSVYASQMENRHEIKYHCMVIYLRQLAHWINRFNPRSVHVFWDTPRVKVWRRKIMPGYKDRSTSSYIDNLGDLLESNTAIAKELLSVLNVRQYYKEEMEADDLIYSAASLLHPKSSIIVSTDSDLTQIPYMISSCQVFDPQKMSIVPVPQQHPAYVKALMGDKADTIKGYSGIGVKRSVALLESMQDLQSFLDKRGRETYHLNLLVTDLSLCPKIHSNRCYVQRMMASTVEFNKDTIKELIKTHKIVGLDTEYANLVPPFNRLK